MKKNIILIISILLSATTFFPSFAIKNKDEKKTEPYLTRTFRAETINSAEVLTMGGSITVIGDAVSEVVVEMFLSRNNRTAAQIEQIFNDNYSVEIDVKNGKLFVIVKQKQLMTNWNQQGLNISFKILVPKEMECNLQTSGGSIIVENISGMVSGVTSGGNIIVNDSKGNISMSTAGGNILAENISGTIKMITAGGNILAENINGIIKFQTSGGNIKLNNINGDIDVITSGGNINANSVIGTLKAGTAGGNAKLENISGNVNATTSGGTINAKMKSTDEYIILTNNGNINLTLPAGNSYNLKITATKIDTSGLKNFSGNISEKSIEGTVGQGGTRIELGTTHKVSLIFE